MSSKIKSTNNVPKLRFPEFCGEWEEKKLERMIQSYNLKSKKNNEYEVLTSSNKGLILQSKYFGENRITERNNQGFNVIPPNYITYRSRSDNRKFTFNLNNLNQTGVISVYYPVFRIDNGDHKFFIELFNYHQNYIGKYSVGTSQTVLSLNELKKIKFFIPSHEEQQKMASFLSSVDQLIENLEKQKAYLEKYKKGMIQKIFSQEIRFKDDDGNEYPDWKNTTLESHLSESRIDGSTGLTAQKLTVKLWNKGVYKKNDVRTGSANTKYYIRKSGQLIYSKLDFLNCAFGIISEELDGYESTVDLPTFDIAEDLDSVYLLTYISRREFYKKYGDIADGSRKAKRIHVTTFFSMPFKMPMIGEQQKIASFLSSIDQLIESKNKQVKKANEWKKGLLQRMFV